jgi:polar amino acid transport system permease protein
MTEGDFQFFGYLLRGAGITVWISWLALLLGALVGTAVACLRLSRWLPLRLLALAYIEAFRSIPILVLLFFCYFGLSLTIGIDLSPFAAATLALMLEASSMMAVIVAAGIESVGHGQWDAGLATGMRGWQAWIFIVMPQAIRVILPPSVGVYISTLKDSSLASIIGYVELTKTGMLVRESTGSNLEILMMVAALYFVINYSISLAGGVLEERFRIVH